MNNCNGLAPSFILGLVFSVLFIGDVEALGITAEQESIADAARRVRAEKELRARHERSVEVYDGGLTFKAVPRFIDAQQLLVNRAEIKIRNSSARPYRFVFVVKCREWNKSVSENIGGSSGALREKVISVDLRSPCSWNDLSLEQLREAEGLEGPEPRPSKVPGIDDAELARQARVQRVVESNPKVSMADLQRRVDEACKRQPLGELATAPVSSIGDHMTACAKAYDDLLAALRVQAGAQERANAEALTQASPSGVVVIRLTGDEGLPFGGDCVFSSRAGSTAKSYAGSLPFQATVANTDNVNCSFISKSDFRHRLKLEVIKDGRLLGDSETDAPYGLVSVSRRVN